MATTSASVVWVDGEFVIDRAEPDAVRRQLGTALGISPVAYVRDRRLLEGHVRTLGLAASLLGYDGFDAGELMTLLSSLDSGLHAVSMVPTPASHRAMPPGERWTFEVEPVVPTSFGRPDGVRLALGEFRRNQTSAATNVLLRDDAELWAGSSRDPRADATLWLDLSGHVACVDQCTLAVAVDDRVSTPPLRHGALRSAWRHALLARVVHADAPLSEAPLTLDDVLTAQAVALVTPWGDVCPVASLDDRSYDLGASRGLAATLSEALT